MRKLISTLLVLGFGWTAPAVETKAQLEQKAQKWIAKFQRMQQNVQKRVPPDALAKAKGIILLDRMKAGFVFAFQGGGGLAMVKDKKGKWSPVAFMKANEASLGFQIGGQQSFLVILLMNEESAKSLITEGSFDFGGEARGTAGDTSAGVEGKIEDTERAMLIYDDRDGLFGGAAIKGGALSPHHEANAVYYGAPVTIQEILFEKKVKGTELSTQLSRFIEEVTKARR